ncbi:MAG: ATP synthase F1 subunit epsilon [Candidatus Omnitrophica bacterium]|nr:ATP synthase F1 subunit epsilon [Candidatus Omnitrophota bacterium]MCB9748113.1 ATP synthase F1 subunit epsilon [Candidatus Omnitrophota bacterium]
MANLHLSIITPNGKVFDESVESVSVPGEEGSVGILANHAPFVTTLKDGTIEVRQNQSMERFNIKSGILEVDVGSEVLILVDQAIKVDKTR